MVSVVSSARRRARRAMQQLLFRSSSDYWERRYARGGNSGPGSYGRLAIFKAGVLNDFVREHDVVSVVEFGCGDGHQLSLAEYPRYTGTDVSRTALELCRERFANDTSKLFRHADEPQAEAVTADMAISLDVILHLVEDEVYEAYMRRLFGAGQRFVVVYSPDADTQGLSAHVRYRAFSNWVEQNAPEFELFRHVPNPHPLVEDDFDTGTNADFWFFRRR